MRDYGTIHNGFWSNESLRPAGDDARMLAAYLLTSPHTNTLGAFRLPDAYACEDLGWVSERFQNSLETLSDIGFVKYDPAAKFIWIVNFLKWNRPANPNIWKAIEKAAKGVPSGVAFKDEILALVGVFETVSEPLNNTPSPSQSSSFSSEEPDEKSKTNPSRKRAPSKSPLPEDFGISARVRTWASEKGYDRLEERLEHFKGKALANAYTYADWNAAFIGAIREDWAKLTKATPASKALKPGGGRQEL